MAVKQFSIILAVTFVSWAVSEIVPLPVPHNVVGFMLLFFALLSGIIKEQQVDKVCDFILRYMALFFVVPIAGVIEYGDLLKDQFTEIFVPLGVSILLGFFAAGKVTQFIIHRGNRKETGHGI